ncbi:DUF679 domain membrane protein 2, Arabidopsis thaliana DUF679 domain membrane protein 2 [Hibiscus trionum]|uniref:DUF679 domain membrane protein 2, Arabidopsis thaliana DUF679 domain membrane protein 2 n=1 Tax=Hibiscus trionum TaxID=183268 RepID=A0A9W7LQW5_HIBTR|nr:DUF679 domain membrane protein 2, Arabidopsis thaliana DUF679 domain membrane protein 2 [Hibiscus trionum]
MARSGSTAAATSSSTSTPGKVFASWGNLIKILPTAAVFVFQFLNPLITSNGNCGMIVRKVLECTFIGLCCFFCAFACFTDSYRDRNGVIHYGVATLTGFWPSPASGSVDPSRYRLKFGDFVHAFFSLVVFAAFSLLDSGTVKCLYPQLEFADKLLVMVLPPAIGAITGVVFIVFPYTRHGLGYPPLLSNDGGDDS